MPVQPRQAIICGLLLASLLAAFSSAVLAAASTLEREMVYVAKDGESKSRATAAARRQLVREVIEEHLDSKHLITLGRVPSPEVFRKSFVDSSVQTSNSFMRVQIKHSSWDGGVLALTAKVRINYERLDENFDNAVSALGLFDKLADRTYNELQQAEAKEQKKLVLEYQPGERRFNRFMTSAHFANVSQTLRDLRMRAERFHALNGTMPTSVEELRLERHHTSGNNQIDEIAIDEKGALFAFLSEKIFGKNAVAMLKQSGDSDWICYTNLPEHLRNTNHMNYCVTEPVIVFRGTRSSTAD